jgi:hypothetical protein
MGYNLLMPISKFASQIAYSLTDYLTTDNPTALDVSDTLDMAQQALGTVASAISSSYTYFWSRPIPVAPRPSLYASTPQQYQATGSGGGGKAGIERARAIARVFEVVHSEENLAYALSSSGLVGGIASRRTELLNSGFNVIDPQNKLLNRITQQDCDHILAFISKRADFFPSRVADRVLEVIKKELDITPEMLRQEEQALTRGPIQIPVEEDEGFEILHHHAYQSYDNSDAPDDLWKPEEALMKVIYDETVILKQTLRHEVISPISPGANRGTPSSASSAGSSRHSSFKIKN